MQGEFAPTAQMWVVADELMATSIPAIDGKARALALPLVSVPD
ncbi:MAG: hypothetical protein ACJA2W_004121 [Planctomycetota bacterium]|jgi:hypothetical protein